MALHNFRQVFLPYGFSRKEGRYGVRWEAFNREYSPLGCTVPHTRVSFAAEQELTNESDRRALLRANTRLEKYIEQIAHTTNGAKNEFWLYNDRCYPDKDKKSWQTYQLRLEALCIAGSTSRNTKRLKEIIATLKRTT